MWRCGVWRCGMWRVRVDKESLYSKLCRVGWHMYVV